MTAPISLVLLRGMLPDLSLRPGAIVHGRVLDAQTLVLEGVRMAARLPDGVQAGQRLRLRVEETTSERVHLRVIETPQAAAAEAQAAAVPTTAYAVALPGGAVAQVHVAERDEARGRSGARPATAVAVRYDSPTLGRLDVRLDRGAAAVHVSAGEPAQRVREAAEVLREALARVTGGPVQVTVHPREETLDVRV